MYGYTSRPKVSTRRRNAGGLQEITSSPGFFAEWSIVDDAADCVSFQETPGHGLVGHNNEQLSGMTSQQCV